MFMGGGRRVARAGGAVEIVPFPQRAVMTRWTTDELDGIGATEELDIAPNCADGSGGPATTIWVVRVGDGLYVRSWRGSAGSWFRRALQSRAGRVRVDGRDRDVTFEPGGGDRDAIDAAYRAKYGQHGSTYVDPMIGDEAAAATLRLDPR
jgi:hypothetical protein